MESDRFPGSTKTRKALVDEERAMVIIERSLASDKSLHPLDPFRVVDESFKRLAGLIDLLEVDAIVRFIERMHVHISPPITKSELQWSNGIVFEW